MAQRRRSSFATRLMLVLGAGLLALVAASRAGSQSIKKGRIGDLARTQAEVVHHALAASLRAHSASGAGLDLTFANAVASDLQGRLGLRTTVRQDASVAAPSLSLEAAGGDDAFFRYEAPLGEPFSQTVVRIEVPRAALRETADDVGGAAVLFVVAVVGSSLAIFFTVRQTTRRLSTLNDAVRGVMSTYDLTRTIDVRGNDEVAEVASSFNALIEQLREVITALRDASLQLKQAGANLNASSLEQQQIVVRQAAAIQESLVTAEEIKRTSLTAADRADGVLKVADQALKASEKGETSIEQSLTGLSDIRSHVGDIAERITQLSTRTQQISGITGTVKDLADSSNMLALNAAIEAVRSGEHGKGFGVVAREIRNLADQSITATRQVREILEDIGAAIQATASITEEGSARIEVGLLEMKASGETLRSLAHSVQENSAAARQIAAAVSQQNAGIVQIFTALSDQSKLTEETLRQLTQTSEVASEVKQITERVSTLVQRYRV